MRIWSLHPQYLDSKGLLAVWREGLLAKHVLEGKTKGYTSHPQLQRFKAAEFPALAISQYLSEIFREAERRGYHFDKTKIDWDFEPISLTVTSGQLIYEKEHLLRKLEIRDPDKCAVLKSENTVMLHSMFRLVAGTIEEWEKL